MKHSPRRSFDVDRLICPACGSGELRTRGAGLLRCVYCELDVDDAVLEALLGIVTLPDALGRHACECGHPEMRRLPGGIYRCPACCSEVLPVEAN